MFLARQHLYGALPAVDPYPVAGFDRLGGRCRADHAGDAVLAADDRRVGEARPGVTDARLDDAEDGGPLGRRPAADEDLSRLDLAYVGDRGDHPGDPLDDALGRREAA